MRELATLHTWLAEPMGQDVYRLSDQLRDEAPAAYKDIRAVLRAQHDLVKATRTLRPILSYKGT